MTEREVDWSKRNEPAMRDRIVAQYFDFAIAMARRKLKKLPSSVDPHGIESAALDGLLYSIERFDVTKGMAFTTFASYRIRGAILDSLRKDDHLSRTSRSVSTKRRMGEESLSHSLGKKPNDDEACAHAGLSTKQLMLDVRAPIDIESEAVRFARARKATKPDPDTSFFRSDAFRHFTRGLDLEGQTILYLYYFRQATMKNIAIALGLSESRVSQLHSHLLARIRSLGKERIINRV